MSTPAASPSAGAGLPAFVDSMRLSASEKLDPSRRASLGQFFTPLPVAALMAALIPQRSGHIRLLDPGAGVGVLAATWIALACDNQVRPESIEVTAFEVEPTLVPPLRAVLDRACEHARRNGISASYVVKHEDFIRSAVTS